MAANDMAVVLYIHGMGGGGDSRIPSILRDRFGRIGAGTLKTGERTAELQRSDCRRVDVVVRTYDFDPEIGHAQIAAWVEELQPDLIVGESLGALQAMRISGIPHLFVSPALNSPLYFRHLAWLVLLPGVSALLDWIYRPREGDRQSLHFSFSVMRKYGRHRSEAMKTAAESMSGGRSADFFAFFGEHDHYRRSGIVSVRTWKKHFGNSYAMYGGTHFMEEEYIDTLLVPKILDVLKINK